MPDKENIPNIEIGLKAFTDESQREYITPGGSEYIVARGDSIKPTDAPDISNTQFRPMDKARIGIVETLYHQLPNTEPMSVQGRYSRWLDNADDGPCQMRVKIGNEWTPIKGWIKYAGMIHIRNEEGDFRINPTDEERTDAMKRIIFIGVDGCKAFKIRPGETFRGEPDGVTEGIELKCEHGTARCTITVFPA